MYLCRNGMYNYCTYSRIVFVKFKKLKCDEEDDKL